MSEARRSFCRHGTSFLAYMSVAVQYWLCVDYLSPYCYFINSSGVIGFVLLQLSVLKVGTDCKNCDEFMNFIVRVICRLC